MQNRMKDTFFTNVISLCEMVSNQNIIFVEGVWKVLTKITQRKIHLKKNCPVHCEFRTGPKYHSLSKFRYWFLINVLKHICILYLDFIMSKIFWACQNQFLSRKLLAHDRLTSTGKPVHQNFWPSTNVTTIHKTVRNWTALRLVGKFIEGRNYRSTCFPTDCRSIVRPFQR